MREALADPTFVNHHHLRPTAAQLSHYESQTRDIARGSSFATRHDLREAVRQAALAAQSQVGVPFVAAVFEYLCGVTNSLDHYTAFLTGDQLDEVYNQIDGSFVGLGIEIRPENGAGSGASDSGEPGRIRWHARARPHRRRRRAEDRRPQYGSGGQPAAGARG
ncbi:MAG: hypothetical protein R3C10_16155 [Pirellulales bacterium]